MASRKKPRPRKRARPAVKQPRNSHGEDRAQHLRDHQWPPGQSGNPQGRPKGRTLTERIRQAIERPVVRDGKPILDAEGQALTYADLIVQRVIRDAAGGQAWAWQEIGDRLDPKAKRVEFTEEITEAVPIAGELQEIPSADLDAVVEILAEAGALPGVRGQARSDGDARGAAGRGGPRRGRPKKAR